MSRLILVRHGVPVVETDVPSPQWRLSDAGRHAVQALTHQGDWPMVSRIFHSRESKARDTAYELARSLNAPVTEFAALGEIAFIEPKFYDPEPFDQLVEDFLVRGIQGPFAESYEEAERRIVDAVVDISRDTDSGIPIAVSHGRIFSVLWSYLIGQRLSLLEWKEIPMPGLAVIDPQERQILVPWTGTH